MGNSEPEPVSQEIKGLPKNQTAFKVDVEYCGAWGGLSEANQTSGVLKTVFPNIQINQYTPGKTGNLIVRYNGEELYNKKKGDGAFNNEKGLALCNKLSAKVKWAMTNLKEVFKWTPPRKF